MSLISDYAEKSASIQHAVWAHWMKYMFKTGGQRDYHLYDDEDNAWIMDPANVRHWQRQMHTHYKDLSEKEKQSDRDVCREHGIPELFIAFTNDVERQAWEAVDAEGQKMGLGLTPLTLLEKAHKAAFANIRGDFKEPKRKRRRRAPMPTGSGGDEE